MRRRAELLDEIEALGRCCSRPRRRPIACPNCGRRNVDYCGSSTGADAPTPAPFCSLDCKASFEYRALVQRAADREMAAVLEKAASAAPTAPTTLPAIVDWELDASLA
ncbi:hypothetical protein PINS_up013705 [Pythium insidiosum]|nr:hypothetical protein PINS_up013705 [Pythium insidiosum]